MTTLVVGKGAPTKPTKADPRNLADIALAAWFDFELARCDIAVLEDRLRIVVNRLKAAELWFATHAADDPRYREACGLKIELENAETEETALLDMNRKRAFHHLINVYLALTRHEALHGHERVDPTLSGVVDHIRAFRGSRANVASDSAILTGLWRSYFGGEPPGPYPPDKTWNQVDYRLGAVPVWQMDELREALERKRKRHDGH